MIAEAVNFSIFMVLGGDFNENGFKRSVMFKFCLDLGLVNSFTNHHLAKSPTWYNSQGIKKTIDFIFIGSNFSSTVAGHWICSVSEFFDMDHEAVLVSIGLSGLLDVQLNSLCKQANKDYWKFKIKAADGPNDVDTMWAVLEKVMVESANKTFLKHWFSEFHCSKNKLFSRFFGLELLIAKIVKKFGLGDLHSIHCFVKTWSTLDSVKAHAFADLVSLGEKFEVVLGHLLLVHKECRKLKMHELRVAEEDCAFSGMMDAVSLNELLLVVNGLPDGKAADLSGIFNELWKHSSIKALGFLSRLLNTCLVVGSVLVS
ncbi:hypothetical protein G9A89_012742 [Geosiphon pyriformis]|nr:hypothetical protein G9A89_012742 [Geosiphon pyriformis]